LGIDEDHRPPAPSTVPLEELWQIPYGVEEQFHKASFVADHFPAASSGVREEDTDVEVAGRSGTALGS
jgi:hypothetical protein